MGITEEIKESQADEDSDGMESNFSAAQSSNTV